MLAAAVQLRREKFDRLVLGNVARGMLPGVNFLRKRGVVNRGILIAHREPRPPMIRALRRWPLDVVAVSESVAAPFRGAVAGGVSVYYGLPNAHLFTPRPHPKPADAPVEFFLLGKMDSPLKGVDIALEAFALLPPDVRRRCRLHLASYKVMPEGMPEGVIPHTWMPAEAVPAFMREMDVLLIPSRVESFSQVIVQAMLCAMPVVVSDLPPLVEKLDAGGGVVCRTPAEYAAAMERFATDPALRAREGDAGRRTALARYVWDTRVFAQRFLEGDGGRIEATPPPLR